MSVALVTGGSRGIGAATARRLARDGHDVAVGYHSDAATAAEVVGAVHESGRRGEAFAADMEDADAAAGLVAQVEAALRPVDILIANAGVNRPGEQDVRKIGVDMWDASKAGLHGLAHSLSQLAAGKGVTVNVVAPALIATDMMPADLISAVVRNGYLTNQSILIDGGMRPS